MGELDAAMEALQATLAAACPGRMVSRSFVPMSQRTAQELETGVMAVMSQGERGYANYRGREADLGTVQVVLLAQIKVAENTPAVTIESAEFALAEQIKQALQGPLLPPLRQCLTTGFRQSGQTEHPYGWVLFECEVMT